MNKEQYEKFLRYICFLTDNKPENFSSVGAFDAARRAVHFDLARSFGFDPEDSDEFRKFILIPYDPSEWKGSNEELAELSYWATVDAISLNGRIHTSFSLYDNCNKHFVEFNSEVLKVVESLRNDLEAAKQSNISVEEKVRLCDLIEEFEDRIRKVEVNLDVMHGFLKLPRESYLSIAVDEYYNKPLRKINEELLMARGIVYTASHK